jgi:hypothetical protein
MCAAHKDSNGSSHLGDARGGGYRLSLTWTLQVTVELLLCCMTTIRPTVQPLTPSMYTCVHGGRLQERLMLFKHYVISAFGALNLLRRLLMHPRCPLFPAHCSSRLLVV